MTLSEASLLAFTAFSGLRLVSYLPQIYKVARDRNGASAISYATWTLWTSCNLSTGLYAVVNLSDPLLAAASVLYALCCLAVIALTAAKRRRLSVLRPSVEMDAYAAPSAIRLENVGRERACAVRPGA
jgi:ABC-type transport system involved in cytochrome c biogenesis permease subunit